MRKLAILLLGVLFAGQTFTVCASDIPNASETKAGEIWRHETISDINELLTPENGVYGVRAYADDVNDWDSQFFIVIADEIIEPGTPVSVRFQYRKDGDGKVQFNAWGFGDPHAFANFDGWGILEATEEWQSYEGSFEVDIMGGGIRSLGVNASIAREAGTLLMRNIVVEVDGVTAVETMGTDADEAVFSEDNGGGMTNPTSSNPLYIIPKVLKTDGMDDNGVKYLAKDSVIEYELGLPKTKSVFEYDDRDNKTSETVYSWNPETNNWDDSCKYVNTYDDANNRTLIASYVKDGNNWLNSGKMDLIYDENGNKSLEAYYYWNAETNSWVGDHGAIKFPYYERDLIWDSSKKCWELTDERLTRYSMSADFLPEYDIYEAYDANIKAWVNSSKIEFEYDGNGNEILEKKYKWNAETNAWVNYRCDVTNWYPNGYYWSNDFCWDAENAQWQGMGTSTDANGEKTVIWSDWRKTVYSYDANERVILEISSIWNDDVNDWEKASKSEYSYDANGNKTLSIFCFWDNEKNDWANYSKREFSYSETKNTETVYSWNAESNGWIGTYKYDYAYKDNSYETLRANYEWDIETNTWIGDWCDAFWYDAEGNSHSAYCYWNDSKGQWDLSSRELFQKEYNAAGNKTLELYVVYDANTNLWRDYEKNVYTYNTNGDETRLERFSWNAERNEWISYYYKETTYDANGKEKLEMSYIISDIETNEWVGNQGTAHWYDADGGRYDISFDWNSEKGQWDLSSYDVLVNTEYDGANNKTLELYKAYNANTDTWVNSRKIEFAYNSDKTIETTYKWDTTSTDWVASSKTEITFDENIKNNTSIVEYKWSTEGNSWIGSSKIEYVFAGNKPSEINYNWNYDENKFEYTAEGLPIQQIKSVWNPETSQWVNANKLVLSDDPNFVFVGKPLYPVYYSWDAESNDWEESSDFVFFLFFK